MGYALINKTSDKTTHTNEVYIGGKTGRYYVELRYSATVKFPRVLSVMDRK